MILLLFLLPFLDKKLTLVLLPAIQKIEQEKTNRDHTIRSLNDEIANQDEVKSLQILILGT